MNTNGLPSVVLVHGGFVDGSGWQPCTIRPPAEASTSAWCRTQPSRRRRRRRDLARSRPTTCRSYSSGTPGGAVIIEAGTHDKVAALPTSPRSPPTKASPSPSSPTSARAPVPPILPPVEGFLFLDRTSSPSRSRLTFLPVPPVQPTRRLLGVDTLAEQSRSRRRLGRAGTGRQRGPDDPRRPSAMAERVCRCHGRLPPRRVCLPTRRRRRSSRTAAASWSRPSDRGPMSDAATSVASSP
jgi:hypothetical protein